jgi:hypothetical protein
MKALPWIVAGIAIGVIVTFWMRRPEPETEYAEESDGVESAARKTYGWGTKTLIGGRVGPPKAGGVEESVGQVIANNRNFEGPGVPLRGA